MSSWLRAHSRQLVTEYSIEAFSLSYQLEARCSLTSTPRFKGCRPSGRSLPRIWSERSSTTIRYCHSTTVCYCGEYLSTRSRSFTTPVVFQDLHSAAWFMFVFTSTSFGTVLDLLSLCFTFIVVFSFLLLQQCECL